MMAQSRDGIAGSRTRADRVATLMVGVLIAAAALAATVRPEPAVAVQRLPSGFVLQDIATGMTSPSASGPCDLLTDFAFLPDEGFVAVLETSADGRRHSFGSIVVEPDGTLWTTVGDGVVELSGFARTSSMGTWSGTGRPAQ